MAEVIVQEESLVTVADAIREKTGGTEGLVFPTGFAEAISGIGGDVKVAVGTYLYNDGNYTTTPIPITHGLGVIPDFIFVFDTESGGTHPTGVKWGLYAAMYRKSTGKCNTVVKTADTSDSNLAFYNNTAVVGITSVSDNSFSIGGNYAYPISHKYQWLAVAGVSE